MLNIVGLAPIQINFPPSKESSQQQNVQVGFPPGTTGMEVSLQGFDISYTDTEEYGFGRLQVNVQAMSEQTVQCTVTLRDNNIDEREWQGTVWAMAIGTQSS